MKSNNENGLNEPLFIKEEKKEFVIVWPKFFVWLGLFLSIISPTIGVIFSALGLYKSFNKEYEEEVSIVAYLGLGIEAFLIIFSIIITII